MKFATFELAGHVRAGVVVDEYIVPFAALLGGREASVLDIIAEDLVGQLEAGLSNADERVSIASVQLLPPIPHPGKIICIGANYEDHRLESKREKVAHPTVFVRFPESLIGASAPILLPPESGQLDFEGEIAIAISKPGRRIKREDAYDYVFGYACFNDASIRDWQRHAHQWTPGKNFDGTGAFGPWLVTADAVGHPDTMTLMTRLNGEIVQQALGEQMIFNIPDIIAYVSSFTTLQPGDVIVTGTPGGVGFARTPQLFMKAGDRVEVEVTGLGILSSLVVAA